MITLPLILRLGVRGICKNMLTCLNWLSEHVACTLCFVLLFFLVLCLAFERTSIKQKNVLGFLPMYDPLLYTKYTLEDCGPCLFSPL